MTISTIGSKKLLASLNTAIQLDISNSIATQNAIGAEEASTDSVSQAMFLLGVINTDLLPTSNKLSTSDEKFYAAIQSAIGHAMFSRDGEIHTKSQGILVRKELWKLWTTDKAGRKEFTKAQADNVRYASQQIGSKLAKYRGQLETKLGIVPVEAPLQGPDDTTPLVATSTRMQGCLKKIVEARAAYDKAYAAIEKGDTMQKAAFHLLSDKLIALLVAPEIAPTPTPNEAQDEATQVAKEAAKTIREKNAAASAKAAAKKIAKASAK